MGEVYTEETIKVKLSGKFAQLYPVYQKLRDELFKIGNIKIYLKTIYMRIDFENGCIGVIYWKDSALELALPITIEHERVLSAKHLNWKGIDKMLRLSTIDDIDSFVIYLLKELNERT